MDEFGMNFHLPFFKHKEGWYFKACFSYVCGGVNLQQRIVEFWGMFFICLQGVNLRQRMVEFWGMFFICLQSVNFWQRMDEFQGMFFICLWGCEFLMNFEVCFSSVYGVWISDKEWMNFKACFSQKVWILEIPFPSLPSALPLKFKLSPSVVNISTCFLPI